MRAWKLLTCLLIMPSFLSSQSVTLVLGNSLMIDDILGDHGFISHIQEDTLELVVLSNCINTTETFILWEKRIRIIQIYENNYISVLLTAMERKDVFFIGVNCTWDSQRVRELYSVYQRSKDKCNLIVSCVGQNAEVTVKPFHLQTPSQKMEVLQGFMSGNIWYVLLLNPIDLEGMDCSVVPLHPVVRLLPYLFLLWNPTAIDGVTRPSVYSQCESSTTVSGASVSAVCTFLHCFLWNSLLIHGEIIDPVKRSTLLILISSLNGADVKKLPLYVLDEISSLLNDIDKELIQTTVPRKLQVELLMIRCRAVSTSVIQFLEFQRNNSLLIDMMDSVPGCTECTYYLATGFSCYCGFYRHNYSYSNQMSEKIVRFQLSFPPTVKPGIFHFYIKRKAKITQLKISFGRYSHLQPVPYAYYTNKKIILMLMKGSICYEQYNLLEHKTKEVQYIRYLLRRYRFDLAFIRLAIHCTAQCHKSIWLLSDRPNKADDNAEHFLRFLTKTYPFGATYYYCLSRKSPDYLRIAERNNILDINSLLYKYFFLHAEFIISSVADYTTINPFGSDRSFLIDLFHFSFIFLQHGVTKDDLSPYINRLQKNIQIFITSSIYEYNAIRAPSYQYLEEVRLTGMPRFDTLYVRSNADFSANFSILLAPTWRQNLMYVENVADSVNIKRFRGSQYFNFFSSLISDDRLSTFMRDHHCKGTFILHPMFIRYASCFQGNDQFEIRTKFPNYQEELKQASVLVTDYSSIAFDFAYLKKPVVYCQFDSKQHYAMHTYRQGYFDYESMGFGTVCKTLDCTVKELMQILQRRVKMEIIYQHRVDNFFYFSDQSNSQRVFSVVNHSRQSVQQLPEGRLGINILWALVLIYFARTVLLCTLPFRLVHRLIQRNQGSVVI